MKKLSLTALFLIMSLSVNSQEKQNENTDAACFETALEFIEKAEQFDVPYLLNNDLLFFLLEDYTLKVKNITNKKNISVTITETYIKAYEKDGKINLFKDTRNIPLLNNQELSNCNHASLKFEIKGWPDTVVKTTVYRVKAIINYDGKEYTIDIGRESEDKNECLDSVKNILKETENEGNKNLYHLDNNFFVNVRENNPEQKNQIQLINLSSDKILSVSAIEMKVKGFQADGKMILISDLNNEIIFIENQAIENCLSVEMGVDLELPDTDYFEIAFLKLKIKYPDHELIINLGDNKNPDFN